MEELSSDKEFIHEEVIKVVEDVIQIIQAIHYCFGIKENDNSQSNVWFTKEKINTWCNQIIDNIIRNLNKLNKPFKYCVTAIIQQNNQIKDQSGMGLSNLFTAGCGYYDNNTDGIIGIQKEINDIVIIASVYAMVI